MAFSEKQQAVLRKPAFGHVATLGPDGSPQSSPVWIDWDGEFLRFSQTTTRQKLQNLRRDGRISVSATDPDDPYMYVEVRGVVDRVEEDPDKAFINEMAQKYLGTPYPWDSPDEERVIVYVRPERFVGR
ncbi:MULTISPECIES: PPOX class F420-dependent oxidoreductase [Nocardiopsis]|jgi:PPOX class probable F420-dependent enzyme|uniref:F420-dependent enzyme n=1 Tax=Nocardiopsis dassonvillei (strain ATCC 23218 / DSM 43111 / CIP 107115 / JCM 7437 / KCTC 9190 / NBRC 14626 / NCTC 10488 / NRRL B-5397 / IMRU 509) TaxID=446468 RepID=D7AX83_NOCDD|nr:MULTISPECIES: PPOX class F420-dependent oxidoreductase [Nocardiopsis]ADH69853.1 putative F420-dependent enzyme [Nocardiopsis dassonvillei subsp. dassonvillei DSM 43111]APC37844.1 PPOX class F420-dependent enzyme [Nocardiopsis dassonvillei]ASU60781.1 PPOX class F420-dependent enzyme [Nocardiopsis dassonvillei]NKY78895.1 PPOX class F420-dependent oxidoreductase [Nocardiopsis dassonvillei]VEI90365.1 PPOX class probable F420-dependent enzyme [Nocardiopsis dassonvillei]